MEVPVLVEPVAGNGYRASVASPFTFTAEGATREEALRKVQELIEGRTGKGGQLVCLSVPPPQAPSAKFAGTWKPDDPYVEEWKQAVQDYRRKVDEGPNAP